MTNTVYAQGLLAVAAWYNEHADVPQPTKIGDIGGISFSLQDKADIATVIRAFKGRWDRTRGENGLVYFHRREPFGPFGVRIFTFPATVCNAVKIGTRIVPGAPEHIVFAVPEHTEDIIEWQCKSVLDGTDGDDV